MEQVGEEQEGGLTAATTSGPMEATGQIDLNEAEPSATESDPVQDPLPPKKEPVSAAARLLRH